jgi:hypothetical protein
MALFGVTGVSSTPNDRTTEAKVLTSGFFNVTEFHSHSDHCKQVCWSGIFSLFVHLWILQQLCCCTIYNVHFIFIISVSKVKKRKQKDKGHVFKEKWEDVLF